MRISLLLTMAGIIALSACKKSNKNEERWVETSQRQEVIVFKNASTPALPYASANGTEGSFYFQSRKLPEHVSRASESGIYFYTIQGDSLLLNTRNQRFFFKMAADGKSFSMGRFFVNPGGMSDSLVFTKE